MKVFKVFVLSIKTPDKTNYIYNLYNMVGLLNETPFETTGKNKLKNLCNIF